MKYQIWAVNKYGDGFVTNLGQVDDPTDIKIHIGTFNDDVVITVEEVYENKEGETK